MTNRKTLFNLRTDSRIPRVLLACMNDLPTICSFVNEATERLVKAAGDTGWWGTWQRVVFNVNPADPYITLPRSIARIINLDICKEAVPVQNEFYEFMEAGIGLQPTNSCNCSTPCNILQTYDRGWYPTFKDLDATGNPKFLRVYAADSRDIGGTRILLQGLDQNGYIIRGLDNGIDIQGEYAVLLTPFSDTVNRFSQITGIQKDITAGDVLLYQVDSVTGQQVLLSRFEASERNPSYRRYFLNGVSTLNCCDGSSTVQVTALAKMDFIPVSVDQDWLLIGNLPALKLECEAVYYGEISNPESQTMARTKHVEAVKLLNEELNHYVGRTSPIVNFAPFGTAHLSNVNIGMI